MEEGYQQTHIFQRGLVGVKLKGSICSVRARKKRETTLASTFRINTQKCKIGALKISSTWQTDTLCRKILLSDSAAKTSFQPNAVWCQKSLKHFSARGMHHAERLVLLLHQKYNPAWTGDPFTVSLGDDGIHMGPIIFFLGSIAECLCRKTLAAHTLTFLVKPRSRALTQIWIRELPSTARVLAEEAQVLGLAQGNHNISQRTIVVLLFRSTCPVARTDHLVWIHN